MKEGQFSGYLYPSRDWKVTWGSLGKFLEFQEAVALKYGWASSVCCTSGCSDLQAKHGKLYQLQYFDGASLISQQMTISC